jgi:energy-coupling factor transport system ATP-binding protein
LALLLSGLLPCQKGQIKIAGKNINEYKELNPQIVGIVFQNPDHQIFNTTIKEEIDFGLRFCNLEPHEIERREKEALSILPFVSDLKGDPRELSFGQKKFLNIVSIAVCKPKILILDEPDLAMDRNQEKFLIKLIQNLAKEGTFIIVISHNEGLISQYANRLLYLKNKLIYDGDPKKFTEIHQKIKNA